MAKEEAESGTPDRLETNTHEYFTGTRASHLTIKKAYKGALNAGILQS